MVTNYEGDKIELKEALPLLPIRDMVIYPFMIQSLFVGRESSIKALEEALNSNDQMILLASQKDISAESPEKDDIYHLGTVVKIMRLRRLPDGRIKILIQGLAKAKIKKFVNEDPFFKVKAERVDDEKLTASEQQVEAVKRMVKENLEKFISLGKLVSPEMRVPSTDIAMVLEDVQDPGRLADIVVANLNLKVADGQNILETLDPYERLEKINNILLNEIEILNVQSKFKKNNDPSRFSKEHLIKEQIKSLKGDLADGQGDANDELAELRDKLEAKNLPESAKKESFKQLSRLEKMHPDSTEASILRSYLDWVIDLPWHEENEEVLNLDNAKEVLDEDHFDLEKIKERILEHLAVRSLKGGSVKGPIICFSGPPGVGKTSLGKSIAKATGREFVRISLGGVKDESEIRGHRRTYVGAMPGRFIQAMKQVKTINPVIMLDEIDKLGSDFRGDPSAALLEVLDPEQNNAFRDNYLNTPYDLSKIMFIATANVLDSIPGPLRDRMEIISLSGYTAEEKAVISKKYIIPKQMDENGITPEHIKFHDEGVEHVINGYTREAGLRNLERQIGSLCRKVARKIASGTTGMTHIFSNTVEDLLGAPTYSKEECNEFDEIGVATGLAWTAFGGEILKVEATRMKGKGVTLTGQLGDVMKESAQAAMGYVRSHAGELGIDEDFFDENEIHIHLPAGAIPKDGPSAGITLATVMISLITQTHISREVAMTGEITLTGKVLPVGGVKEKALAAMRSGIQTIIIPWKNQKDLDDIPSHYREKVNFVPVRTIHEVLKIALLDWKEQPVSKTENKNDKKPDTGVAA